MPDRSDRAARNDPQKDPPNAPRADWRKKGGAAAGKAPSSGPWSGRWTDRKGGDSNSSQLWHRLKLAAWGTLFVVLLGGLFYYLFFLPTRVPLIAAAITDYGQLIPPNSLATEDVEALAQTNRSNMDVIGVPKDYSSREGLRSYWGRQLERIVPGGPGKKTVLFYLSCHGVLDGNGRPCLLLADSQPHDSKTWLPLEELLKDLRDHDRLKKLAAKKVLILDCGRIPSEWRLGILHNGFADKLAQAVEEIKDPNLAVLSAAGPGQTSYAAPELGKTVFGHFLVDGLEGVADDSGDGIIMLQELQNYLTASISRWSTNNRADRQQTLLLPRSADFPVAFAGTKGPAAPAPIVVPDSQREGLAKLWKQHEKLRQGKAFQRHPVGWGDLEAQLVRLEELSLAGSAYAAEFDRVKGEIDGLLQEFSPAVPADAVALSLPLLESWTGTPAVLPATAAKPFSKWRDDRAKAKPGEVVPPPKLPYPAAAAAAVQWLAKPDNHAQAKDVTDALQLVAAAGGRGPADVVEVHFLRMLDAYLDGPEAAKRLATAIRVRDLAERAAAPTDERTQYWVKSLVDAADVRRRGAEDDLFVGDPASLGEADVAWQQLLGPGDESPYAAALGTSRKVTEAYQLRDEAWSRIPALAQWLVEMHRDRPSSELDAALMTLIRGAHELGGALDGGAVAGAWTPSQQASLDEVKKALGQLDKAHADRCDYLLTEAGDDQETLLGIIRVLRVPLLSGEKRSHLADKMLKIMFAQRAAGNAPLAAAGTGDGTIPDADLPEDSAWLAQLTAREHPALAILDRSHLKLRDGQLRPVQRFPGVAATDKSPAELRLAQVNSLAAQGGEVRALLADIRPAANALFDESNRLLEAPRPEPPAVTRSGFSQADRMVRAAAGILVKRTWVNSAEDPARRLQRADWHFAMLWHCARALDDFWGPTPGTKDADYFAVAANAALNSARGLCRNASSFQYRQADLRQLLERRKTAATAGPKPQASDLLLGEDEPNVAHKLTLPAVPDLPPGEAAAFLKLPGTRGALLERLDSQRQPIRRSGLPVDAAAGGKSLDYFVRNEPRLEESLYLEAAALYRGHVLASPFAVGKQSRGDEVAYQRPIYKKPTIQVVGAANQISSVMFIFDCSNSMAQRMVNEVGQPKRMDLARDTLNTIVSKLPDKQYRVGLMLYGHRSGYDANNKPLLRRGAPEGLHPNADVQAVLGMSRPLDNDLRDEIGQLLAPLEPTGQTPLYYALTVALSEFDNPQTASTVKQIIVITDGVNRQESVGGPVEVRKGRKDVEDLIKNRPRFQDIRIDLIGFDMDAERLKYPEEVSDLEAIAKRTGGELHNARDPSSLLKALEKSLGLVQYSVARQGQPAPVKRNDLGRTWTIDDWEGQPGKYAVQLIGLERSATAEVTLEGGESLELFYNGKENRLEHRRYAPPWLRERRENILDPAHPERRYFVGAHLPKRDGKAVGFSLSVQNGDEKSFSPRPRHIWAEITPVYTKPPEKVPVFHFYDLDFEPDRPVPVLQFRVPVWPAEARQAKVQLWFKVDDDAPANWTSPIEKVDKKSFPVSGIAGLELEVQTERGTDVSDPFVVNVTEFDQAPLEMFGTRLEITPPPDRIVHRYITEAKRVRHIFIYKDTTALRTIQPSLHVTTRDRIVRDAVTLEPLTITLPQD
jgi:von Willebrand factor type A domain